jgi:hypothetical protein
MIDKVASYADKELYDTDHVHSQFLQVKQLECIIRLQLQSSF